MYKGTFTFKICIPSYILNAENFSQDTLDPELAQSKKILLSCIENIFKNNGFFKNPYQHLVKYHLRNKDDFWARTSLFFKLLFKRNKESLLQDLTIRAYQDELITQFFEKSLNHFLDNEFVVTIDRDDIKEQVKTIVNLYLKSINIIDLFIIAFSNRHRISDARIVRKVKSS